MYILQIEGLPIWVNCSSIPPYGKMRKLYTNVSLIAERIIEM